MNFILSREFIPEPGIARGPALSNIVQLVEDMTPAKAATLSSGALEAIGDAFEIGLPAAYTMQSTDHALMYEARGDAAAAVAALMDNEARYGASKWASLQLAEKALKAAIALKGGKRKRIHMLGELVAQLTGLGIVVDAKQLIDKIQCTPDIRYGDEPCTRDQALAAHQASLELVNRLRDANVGFRLGIGGPV